MTSAELPAEQLLGDLKERAKELNCLYRVDEILSARNDERSAFDALIDAIPPGWKYPEVCQARITVGDRLYAPADYVATAWSLTAAIAVHGEPRGELTVSYRQERPAADEGPFLKEERRLIDHLAERIGLYLLQKQLREDRESWESVVEHLSTQDGQSWKVLVDFLLRTDRELLQRITRKLINHLCWHGIEEASELLHAEPRPAATQTDWDENRPRRRQAMRSAPTLVQRAFALATRHFRDAEIVADIQTWISEDKCIFLVESLESQSSTLNEIVADVLRFKNASFSEADLSVALRTSLKVGLLQRFFLDRLEFLNIAKRHFGLEDFYDLAPRIVCPPHSHGKLGGKAAGIFLAGKVLEREAEHSELLATIQIGRAHV